MRCPDNQQILHIPPHELVVHQKLIEIYGKNENRPKLEESIRKEGIITPLEVSTRTLVKVVLSGKCRLHIALLIGLPTVPVTIGNYASSEEEIDILFALNLHREEKTHFQKFVEGQYFESVLRPQAKARQVEGASYARQALLLSNLTKADNANNYQELERINVRTIVADNLRISTGSYSKGKKVFEFISQLKEEGKLRSASALQKEFNRSIDAAYKFICDKCQSEVLKVIESGEVSTIRDGLGLVRQGLRNPFRGFEVGQVYQFQKEQRSGLGRFGRVIKITNEFIEFGFRNFKTNDLETISLRPQNVNAILQEEPSTQERERILQLLQKFRLIYPVRVALTEMLNFPHLILEEERYLAFLETGQLEEMIEQRKIEFNILSKNELAGDFCAA
ncbi:hypothetical protein AB0758_45935 [Tolypothrix bouteillei VB521301_2]|uniref:hypothetical protein n=1 Tax=Tolypothrix bouteillei TaxID=1246981 RepID=UPI0005129E85